MNGRVRVLVRPLSVVARLRPGATLAATVTELNAINVRALTSLSLQRLMGEVYAQVFLLHDHEIGEVRPAMLVLLEQSVSFTDCLCQRGQSPARPRSLARKEVAIRGALGAGALARPTAADRKSALAVAGGVAGLLLATWAIRLIRRFAPENIPHLQVAHLNLRVLLFTLVVSLLTGYFVWIGTGAGRIPRIVEQHPEGRRSAKRHWEPAHAARKKF